MPVYVAARRLRVLVCQHQCGARRSGARSAERVFPRRSHLRHQHSRRSGHALRSSGAHCYCWAPRVTQSCTRARSARARARAPSPRAEAVVTRRPTCCDLCADCPPRLTASHRARVSPDGAKTVPVGSNTACACEKRAGIPSGAPRSSARRRRPESLWEARGEGRRRLRPADLRGDVAAPGTHFRVFIHSGVRLLTKGSYSRSEAICNFIGRIDDPTVKCTWPNAQATEASRGTAKVARGPERAAHTASAATHTPRRIALQRSPAALNGAHRSAHAAGKEAALLQGCCAARSKRRQPCERAHPAWKAPTERTPGHLTSVASDGATRAGPVGREAPPEAQAARPRRRPRWRWIASRRG